MANFKHSAILELVDGTGKGAKSAISNFGKLKKAATGFNKEASSVKPAKTYKEFISRTKDAKNTLARLRREVRDGTGDFDRIQHEIKKTKNELKDLSRANRSFSLRSKAGGLARGSKAVAALGATAGFAVAATGFGVTNSFAGQADEVGKVASRVGFLTESFSALQFVVDRTAGKEGLAALNPGLTAFNRRLGELKQGRGELVNLSDDLKRVLLSADGTEDAFVKFIAEAQKIEDGSVLSSVLDKAFSEAGRKLVNFVRTGSAEVATLVTEARELGVIITDEDAARAQRFVDEFDKLKEGIRGAGFALGGQLIEPFTRFFTEIAVPKIKEFVEFINNVDPKDIEAGFMRVADTVERAVGALVTGVELAAKLIDLVTQDEREKQVNKALMDIRRQRSDTAPGGFIGEQVLGTFANIANAGADRELAERTVALMEEQNAILRSNRGGASTGAVASSSSAQTGFRLDRQLDVGRDGLIPL